MIRKDYSLVILVVLTNKEIRSLMGEHSKDNEMVTIQPVTRPNRARVRLFLYVSFNLEKRV